LHLHKPQVQCRCGGLEVVEHDAPRHGAEEGEGVLMEP